MRVLRSVVIRSEACTVADRFAVKHRFHAFSRLYPDKFKSFVLCL